MKNLNARCQEQFVCFISSQKKAKQEQHLGWMNTWMHSCHDTLLVWIAIFPPSANSIDQNDTDPDVIWTRNLLIWSQTRYRCATRPADDRPIWCTSFPDPHSSSQQPIPSAVLLVDWRFETWLSHAASTPWFVCQSRSHGVMVSTLDFESSDPSSNLGGTWFSSTPWRNGSASDSRSEGCVFESRRGQQNIFQSIKFLFASNEDWTHDLWFTRPTLCHWAIEALMGITLNYWRSINQNFLESCRKVY